MDEGFELAPDPAAPALPGVVVMRPNADAAVDALLAEVLVHALRCARLYGSVHIALSAEPDLDPVFRRLMYDPPMRGFPWEQTHLWVFEEPDPPARPTRAATLRAWFEHHSGIPAGRITGPSDVGDASMFGSHIRAALAPRGEHEDRLDLVLLGTSQLGPVDAPPGTVVARGPGVVALTVEEVNRARLVAVFAGGARSRDALGAVSGNTPHALLRLRPDPGQLRWFVDHEACGSE